MLCSYNCVSKNQPAAASHQNEIQYSNEGCSYVHASWMAKDVKFGNTCET